MAFIRLFFILLLQHLVSSSANADSASFYPHHHRHSLQKDKTALLEFKRSIFDPNSTLSNWEEAVFVCNFTGITCDKHHNHVIQINLTGSKLVGKISPFISNLTHLRYLILDDNHFIGTIPPELSSLQHLQTLSLMKNNLTGPIPDTFSLLTNLTFFSVRENSLTGSLPPTFFSNCTKLGNVDLSYNFFAGQIPAEIGNCQGLWTLNLYNNQFTGQLPASLTNVTLYNLDVEYNLLSGELPLYLVGKQPTLMFLHLSYNNMTSHDSNTNLYPFFAALRNCTELEELELAGMGLGGTLPSSIGHPNLIRIELQENRIFGSIPPEIGNLPNLNVLNLTSNLLNGTIPEEIGRLSRLEQLSLSHNFFNMTIPAALAKLLHLGLLDLSNNNFCGEIPASLGDLLQLSFLFLNNNLLSGAIPPKLLKCTKLNKLDLSHNKLTGRIPQEIAELREIRIFINLSHNFLEGPLPIELSKLENVLAMDLSSNNLSGNIFPQISSCIAVEVINFSYNSLQGQLPDSLGELRNLKSFDVSRNNISGMIPKSLSKINLTFLNLSYNNFEGTIPTGGIFNSATNMSFLGNQHLCGKAFMCCVIGIRRVKLMVSSRRTERSRKPPTPEITQNFPRITYRELSEATGGAGNGAGPFENMGNSTANMLTGSIGYIAPEKVVDSSLIRASRDQSTEVKRMWEVAIGELIELGILCTQETPSTRPTMLDAADDLDRLKRYLSGDTTATFASSLGISSSTLDDD
ncbi:hypothetical protein COLO4_26763 [Corchorus olitorius]|uniref:Leucine-rich repeat-containing N-terminal plant-type domain-containing protein n=1 Tax=Corchorus olitorius TaxID=93759 RepID=A0A1R3HUX8_9ROSI|nr:hypothetical protein COLO4_26763 [Corchorus olitorius]